MPSFDITSDVDWQEIDNAVNASQKELATRFDFKNVKSEITFDKKAKTLTVVCSEDSKLDNLKEIIQGKMIKRGISLMSLIYKPTEAAFGGSVRQVIEVQAGISKEKAKDVTVSLVSSFLLKIL